MNRFFSSDHHFFHENICGFAGRPFSSVEIMNYALIDAHNAVVKPGDQWYCLGDFSFSPDPNENSRLLKQMNGQKFLVKGNHDHRNRLSGVVGWTNIEDYREIRIDRTDGKPADAVVMCHFPILSWHKAHYGSYHLHGHSHGNLRLPEGLQDARILDVGVDHTYRLTGAYRPLEWEEILVILQDKGRPNVDHHDVRAIAQLIAKKANPKG